MRLEVLRVFADERGEHGNPLGVFRDGASIPTAHDRQAIATDLGYSETVFVDDAATGRLRIFTPDGELPLAGHPLVGMAWLLDVDTLRPPAGDVPCWHEGETTWIRADPATCPPWSHVRLPDPAAIDALDGPPDGHDFVQLWAWDHETQGTVRARVFAPRVGVARGRGLRLGVDPARQPARAPPRHPPRPRVTRPRPPGAGRHDRARRARRPRPRARVPLIRTPRPAAGRRTTRR